MKDTINKDQFISWFRGSDTYKNNFSYEGLSTLFDYFEELEQDIGEQIEFDPIAICCEFAEYDSLEDLIDDYIVGIPSVVNDIRYFEDRTTVLPIEGTAAYIIQQF